MRTSATHPGRCRRRRRVCVCIRIRKVFKIIFKICFANTSADKTLQRAPRRTSLLPLKNWKDDEMRPPCAVVRFFSFLWVCTAVRPAGWFRYWACALEQCTNVHLNTYQSVRLHCCKAESTRLRSRKHTTHDTHVHTDISMYMQSCVSLCSCVCVSCMPLFYLCYYDEAYDHLYLGRMLKFGTPSHPRCAKRACDAIARKRCTRMQHPNRTRFGPTSPAAAAAAAAVAVAAATTNTSLSRPEHIDIYILYLPTARHKTKI